MKLALAAALLAPLLATALPETGRAPDAVYSEALALYRAGDAPRAAALLAAALDEDGPEPGRLSLLGWCRLRNDELDAAAAAFTRARDLAPSAADPWTGLGYVALRRDRPADARSLFEHAVELAPRGADAWKGLGLARSRQGRSAEAADALARAAKLAPDDTEIRDALRALARAPEIERRPRPAADSELPLRVPFRATSAGFEEWGHASFSPLFVTGVNLSTALPGRFPGEFPDDESLYRSWLDQMGDLGVNTVRLYTLHPPSLYRALAAHNATRPDSRLRLVQGVWSEGPPGDDSELDADVVRTIDAVHGNLELPPRPGRASGVYDVDVSEDVLAFLVGREWEPFVVDAFDRHHPGLHDHDGQYVRAAGASPMEAWLASVLDAAMAHETAWYRTQRPIAFVSWPTLDPLAHPTESSWEEEQRALGKDAAVAPGEPPFDDDRVQVDPTALRPGAGCEAGIFASYHVYPYHPDFLLLDPQYAPNRYLGYLRALKAAHGEMPVLIAELGVPTSRGVSHVQPDGLNHGGHTEREQGRAIVQLLTAVESAGLAGGIVFSWIDEWFKTNWLTADFETPRDRDPLWLNVLDPEECFGLIAARPGSVGPKVVLDGRIDEWTAVGPVMRGGPERPLRALRATADEAYVYLLLEVDRSAGADGRAYWIGIDTYDRGLGDHRFPAPADATTTIGLEFLVELAGRDTSRILVDRPYDPFDVVDPRPLRSETNADGLFVPIAPETNRARVARDGTRYPAVRWSRSPLRGGGDDLSDWAASADGTRIELRLPWALLNVTDPSTRRVAHEERAHAGPVDAVPTDGFRFDVLALDFGPESARVVDRLPSAADPSPGDYPTWTWTTWSEPSYRLEPKASFSLLREWLHEKR